MLVKTSELIGPALDWAGNQADTEGEEAGIQQGRLVLYRADSDGGNVAYSPSTLWAQGGPIIEREGISTILIGMEWRAYTAIDRANGPTLLIAAMRCNVASKLGAEIEVPDELI